MELCSLHPFEDRAVQEFVTLVSGTLSVADQAGGMLEAGRHALQQMNRGIDAGTYGLTHALAAFLAELQPSYAQPGVSLTSWEASVDRGAGMLLRPPSRMLIDAGFDPLLARRLPIRLELSRGMMGGAYVPARLVGELERLLDTHVERTLRRLAESELDAVAILGFMLELAGYCRERGLAIYEAMDVVAPGGAGGQIVTADLKRLDKALRTRLETAAKPPKQPGLFSRLLHRGGHGDQEGAG